MIIGPTRAATPIYQVARLLVVEAWRVYHEWKQPPEARNGDRARTDGARASNESLALGRLLEIRLADARERKWAESRNASALACFVEILISCRAPPRRTLNFRLGNWDKI